MVDQTGRNSVCLTMIVRNEAHIVHELLEVAAPLIDYWVVVDTGSEDGTQDLIRGHMERLGIPGELHERPWRDFGYNRSEAMRLAQGHADYIWMMDADDTVVGTLEFRGLTADVYYMLIRDGGVAYWRRELFRDGVPIYYRGVLHEFPHCDVPFTEERLEGDYYIHSRRLGARNKDPEKYKKDADVLLAEVSRHPDDERSVFYLAQSYHNYGDFENALRWYAHRAEMGRWEEEVYFSLLRVAECMAELNYPWPEVHEAFLRAWEYRPIRIEALHGLAFRLRGKQRYQLGYLYARHAAQTPLPADDRLFVTADVYEWRALDEQAVCASWIGRQVETFEICRQLLARDDIPEQDRTRIATNRDLGVPLLLEQCAAYPAARARRGPAPVGAETTISVIAGPNRHDTELTLNSFLNCCTDSDPMVRFIALDVGLSAADRAAMEQAYPFLHWVAGDPAMATGTRMERLRGEVGGRYWLHLDQGWRFFARGPLIGRLRAVLEAEPDIGGVGVNYTDATRLTGVAAPLELVRSAAGGGHYVIASAASNGPAMIDLQRAGRTGLGAATLDEVLCVRGS